MGHFSKQVSAYELHLERSKGNFICYDLEPRFSAGKLQVGLSSNLKSSHSSKLIAEEQRSTQKYFSERTIGGAGARYVARQDSRVMAWLYMPMP